MKTEDPCECSELPSFGEMLGAADHVVVERVQDCWPPQFVIVAAYANGHHMYWQQRFSSRSAAWDAVEAATSLRRPVLEPYQDLMDNARLPFDVDCGADTDKSAA